jgi:sulfite reductase (NADPH) hemoprotein beta-component
MAASMQIVTGNRLADGVVVYFAGAGEWTPAIDKALVAEDDHANALLAEAQVGLPPLPAVGPILIEITRDGDHLRPMTLRERIRASGPTTGPMAGHTALDANPAASGVDDYSI